MDVNGKVIVITGGGSGIGRQLVLETLRRGARVAAVDVNQDGLDETATLADASDRLATMVVDITDRDATAALPDAVLAAHGAIDGLVNNAGIIQPFAHLDDLDFEAIDRVIDVNLNGTINMVKAFLPHLLERPVAHVANVASMGAFVPFPGQTVYSASKAGVKLLTEGLYSELADTGVGVTVVMPGPTDTGISTNSGVAAPGDRKPQESPIPIVSAEDAATIVLDGIEADRLHVYVGIVARALDVMTRVAPRRTTDLLRHQAEKRLS
jgi:NAD(P)-dependent dehydrogenase (short-subunit alcohol dehydrogenase family)